MGDISLIGRDDETGCWQNDSPHYDGWPRNGKRQRSGTDGRPP